MISLKQNFLSADKKEIYEFYKRIVKKPFPYLKATRNFMYEEILKIYKSDPEIILRMCTGEEIEVLKSLSLNPLLKKDRGYINFILFDNLITNYLVLNDEEKYYIPEDLMNVIKMSFNLYDEKTYSYIDIVDSTIIGICRIYNVINMSDIIDILSKYNIKFEIVEFKKYVRNNLRINKVAKIVRLNSQDYLASKEFNYYLDVLKLRQNMNILANYSLEEVTSIGKYKINLFQEKIFNFLSFLELHLKQNFIDDFLADLIFYCGFDINNDDVLKNICGNLEELYLETKKVVNYFPVWVYNGLNIVDLENHKNSVKESFNTKNKFSIKNCWHFFHKKK